MSGADSLFYRFVCVWRFEHVCVASTIVVEVGVPAHHTHSGDYFLSPVFLGCQRDGGGGSFFVFARSSGPGSLLSRLACWRNAMLGSELAGCDDA